MVTMQGYPQILKEFRKARSTPSDINEHIDRLYELSLVCDSVVEAGVRYVVSTWAFLFGCACRGHTVHSYCWNMLPEIQRAIDICKSEDVPWAFHEGDWLQQEIPETDLLFIDTNHFYSQMTEELLLHGNKARKYIVCHDTTSCDEVGADGKRPGIWQAIGEFVQREREWEIYERYYNCNGLTILKRSGNADQH